MAGGRMPAPWLPDATIVEAVCERSALAHEELTDLRAEQ